MIFAKTFFEKGGMRLKLYSNQASPTIGKLDVGLFIVVPKGDAAILSTYSVGSTFVVDDVTKKTNWYDPVGDIKVCNADALASDRATDAQMNALEAILDASFGSGKPDKTTAKPKTKKPSYLEKIMAMTKYAPPNIDDDGFYIHPDEWYLLLRNVLGQINTLLTGPTGSGKTEIVEILAAKATLNYTWKDMGSMIDPIPFLLGTHRFDGKKSMFDYADFTSAIQKPGIILLDELSRPSPLTTNILLPCLDKRRTLKVEIAGGEDLRDIAIHDKCSFIATANVGAQYTGTMQMDRALTGRFMPIEFGYMEAKHEIAVLVARTGIEEMDAAKIVAVANNVRSQNIKGELSDSISTRETLMTSAMVKDGYEVLQSLERCFLPLFEGTKSEGERSVVSRIIMSR